MYDTTINLSFEYLLDIIDEGLMVFGIDESLLYVNQAVFRNLEIENNYSIQLLLENILKYEWYNLDGLRLSLDEHPVLKMLKDKSYITLEAGYKISTNSKIRWLKFSRRTNYDNKTLISIQAITSYLNLPSKFKDTLAKKHNNQKGDNLTEVVFDNDIKQHHFIREILDTLDVPIAVLTHPEHKYEIVNRNKCLNFSRILGHTIEEKDVIGKSVKEVAPFIYQKGICDMALIAGYSKESIVIDNVEYVDFQGESIFYKLFLCPVFNEDHEVTHIASVGIDLTDEIMFQNKMHELSKAKEEFFSVTSHELRTPINVILSAEKVISNMIKNINNNENDIFKMQRWLRMIRQNSLRLLKLVNNILDLSKINAGYLEVVKKNVDFVDLITKIYNSIAPFVEQKGLKTIFTSNIDKIVMAVDEEKIERIIFNLISNALKYNRDNGMIEIIINQDNNFVYISVKDTGIGIPNDKLDIIFERFLQVNSSLSRPREGAGIGLSLCKAIAQLHNGDISVESKLNEGSIFTLKLPIEQISNKNDFEAEKVSLNGDLANIELSDIYEI